MIMILHLKIRIHDNTENFPILPFFHITILLFYNFTIFYISILTFYYFTILPFNHFTILLFVLYLPDMSSSLCVENDGVAVQGSDGDGGGTRVVSGAAAFRLNN
jgi:hypothetical protein